MLTKNELTDLLIEFDDESKAHGAAIKILEDELLKIRRAVMELENREITEARPEKLLRKVFQVLDNRGGFAGAGFSMSKIADWLQKHINQPGFRVIQPIAPAKIKDGTLYTIVIGVEFSKDF